MAAVLDGAAIRNSGSTNTAPYTILIWSDGDARWIAGNRQKDFTIDSTLAKRFLEDARDLREHPGTPGSCMKSASFGTRTTVTYHGWTSNDLECPSGGSAEQRLASDVQSIVGASGITLPQHRIPLPVEPRRAEPTAAPFSPSPSSKPSARIGGRSPRSFKSHGS
jgi:hypothetical protein